jgi:hypothetical protein
MMKLVRCINNYDEQYREAFEELVVGDIYRIKEETTYHYILENLPNFLYRKQRFVDVPDQKQIAEYPDKQVLTWLEEEIAVRFADGTREQYTDGALRIRVIHLCFDLMERLTEMCDIEVHLPTQPIQPKEKRIADEQHQH